MHLGRLRAYIGDRTFYRSALAVMIPVTLQQLINSMFNLVDNIMVARIDAITMSAVTVANKPFMVYISVFFGFTGAAGLLLSQYYGAGKPEVCQRIFSVEMLFGLLFSLLYAMLLLLFPAAIMRIFVTDATTIDIGVSYLRIVAYSYIPAAFSSVCIFSLRALGLNFLPMVVSIFSIASNAFLNWIFIFGRLGAPRMGAEGAALGTLLSRCLELLIYVYVLVSGKTLFSLRLSAARRIGKPLLKDYVERALPLTLNELMWSGGILAFFWAYARINEGAIASLNVAEQIFNLAWVLFMGVSAAISVMVGKCLGANQFSEARSNAKKLLFMGLCISLLCSLTTLACSFGIHVIFNTLDAGQLAMSRHLLYINALIYPFNAVCAICFFLLRAGGDTRSAMMMDGGYMWVVAVPVALLMATFLKGKIDVRLAFLIVQVVQNAKVVFALNLVKKGHWLRNLTSIPEVATD